MSRAVLAVDPFGQSEPYSPFRTEWILLYRPDLLTSFNGYRSAPWIGGDLTEGHTVLTSCCRTRLCAECRHNDLRDWTQCRPCRWCRRDPALPLVCVSDEPSCPLCLHCRDGNETIVQLGCCRQTIGLSCLLEWTRATPYNQDRCPLCRSNYLDTHEYGQLETRNLLPNEPVTYYTPLALCIPDTRRPALPPLQPSRRLAARPPYAERMDSNARSANAQHDAPTQVLSSSVPEPRRPAADDILTEEQVRDRLSAQPQTPPARGSVDDGQHTPRERSLERYLEDVLQHHGTRPPGMDEPPRE